MIRIITKYLLIGCLSIAFSGFAILCVVHDFSSSPRTYYGNESFSTLEDALTKQRAVVEEAERVGAKILQSDITMTSTPQLSYKIRLPANEDSPALFNGFWKITLPSDSYFPYGAAVDNAEGTLRGLIFISAILMGVIVLLTICIYGIGEELEELREKE